MIYFLRHVETGLIKIGRTANKSARLSTLIREHGDLELVGLLPGYKKRERELHEQFSDLNVRGKLRGREWFRADSRLIDYIDRHATMNLPLPLFGERIRRIKPKMKLKPIPRNQGTIEHRLLDLLHQKETDLGERKPLAYHAENMGIPSRVLMRWLDPDKHINRYDADTLEAFCKYFQVNVGDILYYIPETEGKEQ